MHKLKAKTTTIDSKPKRHKKFIEIHKKFKCVRDRVRLTSKTELK